MFEGKIEKEKIVKKLNVGGLIFFGIDAIQLLGIDGFVEGQTVKVTIEVVKKNG